MRNAKLLESSEMEEQRSIDMASQCSSKQKGYGFKAPRQRLQDTMQFLKCDISLTLVVFTFLVNRLGRQSTDLLLRYSLKRCHWTIQMATLLLSVRAGLSLVTLLVLLPVISMIMLRWLSISPQRADMLIARGSVIFTVLGSANASIVGRRTSFVHIWHWICGSYAQRCNFHDWRAN